MSKVLGVTRLKRKTGLGGMREGITGELGMDMYTVLCLRQMANKDLLCSTGNSAQCYVAAWMGREFGREWIYIYWIYLSNGYMYIYICDWIYIHPENGGM